MPIEATISAPAGGLSVPASHFVLVTPSNTDDLANASRGMCFAVAGDLKITSVGGVTDVIPSGALVAGIIHPIQATRVFATGTTATGIVAWW